MKNFKIGAKIFIAFGIAIALMLLSAAVVFSSNMGIIDNVDKISKDSALQAAGNTLKDNFLLARVAAVRVLSTTDPEVYNSFAKQADVATQNYTEIYNLISQADFLEKFRPSFEKSEADYKAYLAKAEELGKANEDEKEQIDKMNEAGVELAEYGDLIFRDQIELMRGEIAAGDVEQDAQIRRVDRIETGTDIALHISSFRQYAREMMASFDTANMPVALELIDSAYALAEEYNKASTIPKNIENSQLLMDAISEYREALVEFGAACDRAAGVAAELSPLGATSLESLTAAVDALDAAMDGQVQSTTTSASSSLIVVMAISIASILIAIILAVIIVKGITVPVSKMVLAADSLALGDVDVDARYDSKDEIGSLSASFEKMLDGIKSQAAAVEALSNGDLTVSINPRSDKDTVGRALEKMIDNLNLMFGELKTASDQVSSGAAQVSQGALGLASGSSEQAASIEELSASLAELQDKTNHNANSTAEAQKANNKAGEMLNESVRSMGQMLESMKAIDESSSSITRVIKVIDDIAFQTNILALNAAVEAARAGQHGKGFAVVADEVRNLAAKSAEAAKETSALIEGSTERVREGNEIVAQTSANLEAVAENAKVSMELLNQVADASIEQAKAINEINQGMDQISTVVQANSATAEQSAAASEEMSAQAVVMNEIVAKFRLRQSGNNGGNIGATSQGSVGGQSASTGFAISGSKY